MRAIHGTLRFVIYIYILIKFTMFHINSYDNINIFVKWWQNTIVTAEITKGIESFNAAIELLVIDGETICTSAIL